MSGRRGLLLVLTGCVVAGVLVLIASGRDWRHAVLVATTGRRVDVDVTGHSAEPALPALAVAMIVLTGAIIAARRWVRRVVGLVLVVVGGAVMALAVASRVDAADELRRQAFGVADLSVASSLSGWAIACIAAGVIAVLSGALTVVVGPRWPALGGKYDAPSARPSDTTTDWDALDRGEDPTV